MWQPIGVVFASAVALGTTAKWRCEPAPFPSCKAVPNGEPCCTVGSNMGWRYNLIILGVVTLVVFFLRYFIFTFHESPKFLLSRGREAEAIEVLHKIAKFNKAPAPTLTLEHFAAIDAMDGVVHEEKATNLSRKEKNKQVFVNAGKEVTRLKGIFTKKLSCFIFVLLGIAYMGDYWSFNLAGNFLPLILLRNNVNDGRGSVVDTYQQYLIIYSPGIIGAGLALFSIQMPLLGRKWSLVFSAAMQGLSMAMYTQVKNTAGYVGLNALEYIMQTVSSNQRFFYNIADICYSTSTLFFTLRRPSSSTLSTVAVSAVCSHAWDESQVSSHLTPVLNCLQTRAQAFFGSVPVVSGSRP
jgi:hypothetical protein